MACADLEAIARDERIKLEAWTASMRGGFRDKGGAGPATKPDRTKFIVAAGANGMSQSEALAAWQELGTSEAILMRRSYRREGP